MSQLIDKLRRLARGTAAPLGFQPRTAPPEPPVLLIAHLRAGEPAPEEAAALLVEGTGQATDELAPPPGGTPWGVSLETASPEQVSRLKERGCDFLLLASLDCPAAALDTDMGRLLMAAPSLADSEIRALGNIADAAVVDLTAAAFSIRCLMDCHRLAGLLGKPLLAMVSPEVGGTEVRQLAGAGVRGLISRASQDRFQEWHKELVSHPALKTPTAVVLPVPPPPPEETE